MGFAAEFFDRLIEFGAFWFVCGLPVGHDEVFEIGEFAIEAGVFDGWRQVGDKFGVGASLGD